MITRKNYEIYFIEYLDGTLSEAKAAELKTFLLLNPDLSALLEDTDKAKLKAPVLIYRKKNVLKKTEIQECPDYYAIATAETVLTPEENQQLGKRKSDQNFQKLVNTYRQFKVKPDKNIRFEKKKALYHKPAYGKLIIRISAAAAIVMLMISMGRFLIHPRPDQETVLPIAGNAVKIEPAEIIRHTPAPLPVKTIVLPVRLRPISPSVYQQKETVNPVSLSPSLLTSVNINELQNEETQPPQTPVLGSSEIVLHASAQEWKASSTNFETRNIITSVISTGRNLAERTNKNILP